jgi:hypothetical protein
MGRIRCFIPLVVGIAFAIVLLGAGTASATKLCSVKPEEKESKLICEKGKEYGVDIKAGQTLSGTQSGNVTFESIEGEPGTITCTESSFVAALKSDGTSEAGNGITSLAFNSGGGKECGSTVPGTASAALTAENLSYDDTKAVYEGTAAPQGTLTIAKKGVGAAVQIKMVFNTNMNCIYQPSEALSGNWTNAAGGNPSTVTFTSKKFALFNGPAGCPKKVRLGGTYNVRGAGAIDVYIAKE